MEKFKVIKKLGEGAFGSVMKALNKETKEEIAIKSMIQKFQSWDECINLKEIKCLRKFNHPNLIKLKEVVKQNDELFLVFEYFDQDIYKLYTKYQRSGQTLPESLIKSIIYQIISGLNYMRQHKQNNISLQIYFSLFIMLHMHRHGFFHRDLKPENILIKDGLVKIIDFGLAREIRSSPPYTDYVATRWYRAPELLLRSTNYNSPIDIFAIACIMVELYNMQAMFKGQNEMDQLKKIMQVLGTPTKSQWPEGYKLASKLGVKFPQYEKQILSSLIPSASPQAIDLLGKMFTYESTNRPTAQQILNHPFLEGMENHSPQKMIETRQRTDSKDKKDELTYLPEIQKSQLSNHENKIPKPIAKYDFNHNNIPKPQNLNLPTINNNNSYLNIYNHIPAQNNQKNLYNFSNPNQPHQPHNIQINPTSNHTYKNNLPVNSKHISLERNNPYQQDKKYQDKYSFSMQEQKFPLLNKANLQIKPLPNTYNFQQMDTGNQRRESMAIGIRGIKPNGGYPDSRSMPPIEKKILKFQQSIDKIKDDNVIRFVSRKKMAFNFLINTLQHKSKQEQLNNHQAYLKGVFKSYNQTTLGLLGKEHKPLIAASHGARLNLVFYRRIL